MAAKKKVGAKRRKVARKGTQKTMNQFATAARRKTKKFTHDAETAVENAGEWVGDKASKVGAGMKRQPVLMATIATAIGAIGWFAGRRLSGAR